MTYGMDPIQRGLLLKLKNIIRKMRKKKLLAYGDMFEYIIGNKIEWK